MEKKLIALLVMGLVVMSVGSIFVVAHGSSEEVTQEKEEHMEGCPMMNGEDSEHMDGCPMSEGEGCPMKEGGNCPMKEKGGMHGEDSGHMEGCPMMS